MCLANIKEVYDVPCSMITDGWKQFNGAEDLPRFAVKAIQGKNSVELDKWITAEDTTGGKGVKASDGNYYKPGFHVYAEEPKGKSGYRRVFVRNITCMGEDVGGKTVIAQEMYVPSNQNGWPPKPDKRSLIDRAKDILPGNA